MEPLQVKKLSSSVHLDRHTMISTARIELEVQRPLSELALLIVPESWVLAPCFKKVHRVQRDARGEPKRLPSEEAFAFVVEEAPLTNDWSELYYEHVKAGMLGVGSAEFHNLLEVEFEASQGKAELRFGLNQCLASRWGVLRRRGGIDVDRGYTRLAARAEGVTHVDAVKSVRYTPFEQRELGILRSLGVSPHALNELAPTFLGVWMEGLVIGGCSTRLPPKGAHLVPTDNPTPGRISVQ